MRALVIVCATEAEASDIGNGLRDTEWHVVGTGPVEGVEVREGANSSFTDGSWVVFASREQLQEP